MPPLRDTNRSSIAQPRAPIGPGTENFRKLSAEDSQTHLETLSGMLRLLRELASEKLWRDGPRNEGFLRYLDGLRGTMDAAVLKNRIESQKPNRDIAISCAIDPSDSGFPVAVRDFHLLLEDKKKARERLAAMPADKRLVDDALFSLFRGVFPADIVLAKMERDYWSSLLELRMPQPVRSCPAEHIRFRDGMHYFRKSMERLDDHHNLPRFYTVYMKAPAVSCRRSAEGLHLKPSLCEELEGVVHACLGQPADFSLNVLARQVDAVEGVQVEMAERLDIGPFYNRFTQNENGIAAVLHGSREEDCLILFRRYFVQRIGQRRHPGLGGLIRGWWTGDRHAGEFSPTVASPQYALLPHRLIQKVHATKAADGEDLRMFGIADDGGLLD